MSTCCPLVPVPTVPRVFPTGATHNPQQPQASHMAPAYQDRPWLSAGHPCPTRELGASWQERGGAGDTRSMSKAPGCCFPGSGAQGTGGSRALIPQRPMANPARIPAPSLAQGLSLSWSSRSLLLGLRLQPVEAEASHSGHRPAGPTKGLCVELGLGLAALSTAPPRPGDRLPDSPECTGVLTCRVGARKGSQAAMQAGVCLYSAGASGASMGPRSESKQSWGPPRTPSRKCSWGPPSPLLPGGSTSCPFPDSPTLPILGPARSPRLSRLGRTRSKTWTRLEAPEKRLTPL